MIACTACELRFVSVRALAARLAQREIERQRGEAARAYISNTLWAIARYTIPGYPVDAYTTLMDGEGRAPEDTRNADEILDDLARMLG